MEQSDPHRPPPAWTIRRAELLDVPAVARLLGVPSAGQAHRLAGSSEQAIISATRLVLTHVGLDLGEFWVAADAENHVLAAVVLLPAGDDGQERVQLALRLELGLLLNQAPELGAAGVVPQAHWLLLPAVPPGCEPMLPDLLAAAMPTVDASGLPVLSLQHGPPAEALIGAGFEPLDETPVVTPGSASVRLVPNPTSAAL